MAIRGSIENDVEYFARRAGDEHEQSIRAAHPSAQEAHRQMAERYSELARAIAGHEVILGTRSAADPVS